MGYERHDAVIVVVSGYQAPPDVDAFRESLPEEWRRLVIGPVESIANGYKIFAFLPDGSKEGWAPSDDGDKYRYRFRQLFGFEYKDGSSPFSVCWVNFGGDDRKHIEVTLGGEA